MDLKGKLWMNSEKYIVSDFKPVSESWKETVGRIEKSKLYVNLKETLRLDNWKKATVCEIEGNCKIGNWKEVIHFWK